MAEAIGYALTQWQPLNVFCSGGAVSIDSNTSEQEMNQLVLNRKTPRLSVIHAEVKQPASYLASPPLPVA